MPEETKPKTKAKAKHEVRADGSIAFFTEEPDPAAVREVAAAVAAQREKGTS